MAEERMLITGGQRLEGTVRVSGGKNTSVAVISASILSETPCVIENLPNIEDVNVSVETLRHLGAKVNWDPDTGVMEVDSSTIDRTDVPLELCRRMRASSYYIGALLARFGRAQVPLPGGCDIGRRPIDQHIKGMRALGAKVETTRGLVVAQTDGLIGSDVFMDMVTVGGTINVMLAASRANGTMTIYNAAKEPHIVDLANFLNSMGCRVKGAGTDVIRVRGVERLQSRRPYAVIPDQIETGTLMIAAARRCDDLRLHPHAHGGADRQAAGDGRARGGAGRRDSRPFDRRPPRGDVQNAGLPRLPDRFAAAHERAALHRDGHIDRGGKHFRIPLPPPVGDGAHGRAGAHL